MNNINIKSSLILAASAFVFSGCSSSGAPACDDGSVLDVVKQIAYGSILDDYTKYATDAPNYKILKTAATEKPSSLWAEQLAHVEKDASEAIISFSGIRTQGKNDEIRKSECAATITIERKSPLTNERTSGGGEFTYVAQYSDDGSDVYVEAYGL